MAKDLHLFPPGRLASPHPNVPTDDDHEVNVREILKPEFCWGSELTFPTEDIFRYNFTNIYIGEYLRFRYLKCLVTITNYMYIYTSACTNSNSVVVTVRCPMCKYTNDVYISYIFHVMNILSICTCNISIHLDPETSIYTWLFQLGWLQIIRMSISPCFTKHPF